MPCGLLAWLLDTRRRLGIMDIVDRLARSKAVGKEPVDGQFSANSGGTSDVISSRHIDANLTPNTGSEECNWVAWED